MTSFRFFVLYTIQVDVVKGFRATEKLIDELVNMSIVRGDLTTVDLKIRSTGF